jgi:hypothetical protein
MYGRIKSLASLLLLLVFVFPTIIKLKHHHEHFVCHAKNQKHFHEFHQNCSICSFEFSVFTSDSDNVSIAKENPKDSYCNNYSSQPYSNLSQFSFSLRAPPCKTI